MNFKLTDLRHPYFPVLSKLPVSSNRLTHLQILFASGRALMCGLMNHRRRSLSVSITDFLFLKYARRANPRCSSINVVMMESMRSSCCRTLSLDRQKCLTNEHFIFKSQIFVHFLYVSISLPTKLCRHYKLYSLMFVTYNYMRNPKIFVHCCYVPSGSPSIYDCSDVGTTNNTSLIYSNSLYIQVKIFVHIFHCQSDVIFFSMFVHVMRSVSLDVEYYCYCLL